VIPGPRPSKGHDRPSAGRDRGLEVVRPLRPGPAVEADDVSASNEPCPANARPAELPPVTLTRTARGWSVISPSGPAHADDIVEGLTLADLIAEELGALAEPDRTARRSARGPGEAREPAEEATDARVAALERTVAQLEHALAARVSTERAIGVLAERNRTSPREAFESMRREARSSGRPVAELAREVLAGMEHLDSGVVVPFAPVPGPPSGPLEPRATALQAVAAADGRS
jgi:hypothetical protein